MTDGQADGWMAAVTISPLLKHGDKYFKLLSDEIFTQHAEPY